MRGALVSDADSCFRMNIDFESTFMQSQTGREGVRKISGIVALAIGRHESNCPDIASPSDGSDCIRRIRPEGSARRRPDSCQLGISSNCLCVLILERSVFEPQRRETMLDGRLAIRFLFGSFADPCLVQSRTARRKDEESNGSNEAKMSHAYRMTDHRSAASPP